MKITRKVCGLAASLWLFAASGLAFAQTSSPESIGTITSAANNGTDKSMSLLQLVYGAIVSNPLSGASGSGGMISQVFLVLNSCILAVGVIWATYLFGVTLLATGQEGEFLGAKRSSPAWIVRNAIGFSALVPFFGGGGYSGAQVIMLWGTQLGVGIANLTLSAAISVLTSGGTMVATPVAPQVTTLAKSLFEANLCAQAANQAVTNLPNDAGVSADAGDTFSPGTATGKVVLMNPNGLSCGGAEINANSASSTTSNAAAATTDLVAYAPDTSSVSSSLLSAQQSALTAMQSTLWSAAQAYVTAVNGGNQPTDPQTTINQAAQTYQNSIQAAISNASGSISGISSTIQSNLTRDGWIMLGAWYQSFAQANSQLSSLAASVATAVPPTDLSNLPYPQLYQSVIAEYNRQIERDASTSTPDTSRGSSTSTPVNNLFTGTTDPQGILSHVFPGQALVNEVISLTSSSGSSGTATGVNPLIGMKNMGDYILEAGWGTLAVYVGWSALGEASQSTLGSVATAAADFVTFGTASALKGAAQGAVKALSPLIMMLVIALFFFGAMLSVYLPMLPFIIWFGGIMSWFCVVAEGMVAAPLWAFSHLDGEGEGMGQRTQHGYIFLLNVMFRPVFMVLGFLLAGVGIVALGTLLNTMFGVAMQNAQYDSQTGLVSIIGFIVLYVGMCQTLCNSMFSLIHIIPDQVFSWVGGQMAARVGHDTADKTGMHTGAAARHGAAAATPTARGSGQPATAASPGTAPANPVLPPGN